MATKRTTRKPARRKKKTTRRTFRPLLWLVRLGVLASIILIPLLFWLNSEIEQKFSSHEWTIPAKVYARPLELYVGSRLTRQELKQELELLGYKKASNINGAGSYTQQGSGVGFHTRGFQFGDGFERAVSVLAQWSGGELSQLATSTGQPLDLIRLEPMQIGGIYPGQNEDRLLVELSDTPKGMLDCLLAVEDRRFYEHPGISLRGISRAMLVNLRQGRFTQGGSTLTQQLVKNLFLSQDRTLSRKLAEIPMALMLDGKISKNDILQMFINEVFLVQDGNRAVHGFALASQYFFNQPLQELLPHQYALLVGMIKGPSYYHPVRHPERAKRRRDLVLSIMAEQGIMSEEEADYARQLPLSLNMRSKRSVRQPAYLDLVRRQLSEDYRLEDLQTEGLRVFTNFDPLVQLAAEKSLDLAFADIDKRPARQDNNEATELPSLDAGMLVSASSTGDVVAIVGGRKPRFAGFNRALDARRPIGSLVKPAVFLTALERPDQFTLASYINDERFELPQPDGSVWAPDNFDKQSHGSVTLLEALSRSYNQASAALGMQLGIPAVRSTLSDLGVTGDIPELPSLFLGAIELSVMDVASMYQTIASGGFNTPLRAIREILDANGKPIKTYGLEIEQRIAPDTVHLLQYALQEAMRNGTGRSAYQFLPDSLAVAGKTGTSNDQRDSWFAGFSGDYSAVVWMGNDDYETTSLTGSTGALRAWSYLFRAISRESLEFVRPTGVVYVWTDRESGLLSAEHCRNTDYLPYVSGTEPIRQAACAEQGKQRPNWLRWLLNRVEDNR
ncbi:MAG: penicillin-binding protein 1B [Pseudomonadales bacterium]